MTRENAALLPRDAYPKSSRETSRKAVTDAIKQYVRKQAAAEEMPSYTENTQETSERLVLNRIIYGHPKVNRQVNPIDERVKYAAFDGNKTDINYRFPFDFYNYMLEEKAKGSDLYKYALLHFRLSPNVELLDSDEQSIRDIEVLMPEGKMKRDLANYAHISRSDTVGSLFMPAEMTGVETLKFKAYLYANHPELLAVTQGVTEETTAAGINKDRLLLRNSSEDFIRMGDGTVWYLTGTNDDVSTYTRLSDSIFGDTNVFPRAITGHFEALVTLTGPETEEMVSRERIVGKAEMKRFEC